MKAAVISDLHVDMNEGHPVIAALCEAVKRQEIELLIVAGDLANHYEQSLAAIRDIREGSGAQVLFVPGNHDYWSIDDPQHDTWATYRHFQQTEGCLSGGAYAPNEDWIIIGDSGWYDYSFGTADYTEAEYDAMKLGERTWKDSLFVNWGRSNKEIHRYFYEKMAAELALHQGKKVILVTHMLTDARFTVPVERKPWDYFNAFLGSEQYGELYARYDVRYSIMGHVHYRRTVTAGATQLICPCLGYNHEWHNGGEARQEVEHALQVVELD
ncbi:metallophosphoesterase [Paenibacillus sp. GCM10027626]|uniref:metallophosphoesterase n=1 Tax=Paenibacillus sp. GCM10027626 TaxID=3273411 RepID=UPI0036366189